MSKANPKRTNPERPAAATSHPCRPDELPAGAKHRPSKAGRWRALVLLLVHVAIAVHVAHWLSTGKGATLSPLEPSEGERFARESIINTGLVFFALTILSTLVLGRWFCGWACHLVALQDACRWVLVKLGITPRPLRSRWLTIVPLLTALYLFVWPVVPRILAGEDLGVRGTEFTREGFWDTFPPLIPAIVTLVVTGFVAVYVLGSKGYCTYGCPYGAFFALADKVAPGRIRVTDACSHCGQCTAVCTSNVDVAREVHDYGMVVDVGCMKCYDCVSVCPTDALYFGFGRPALGAKPVRTPRKRAARMPWPEELTAAAATVYGYVAMRGFNQGHGLLLSAGVAVVFGGLTLLVLRVLRRRDVALPGLPLAKGGRVRPAGFAVVGLAVVAAGLGVPYGVLPEVAAWRAQRSFEALTSARLAWTHAFSTFGLVPADAPTRATTAALLDSAARVDRGAWVRTERNALRRGVAALLQGDRKAAAVALDEALARGADDEPEVWVLYGDALFAAEGASPAEGIPPAASLAAYDRALALDPGYVPAAARWAEALRRRAVGEPPDPAALPAALTVLDRALATNPDAALLRVLRAQFRLGVGDGQGSEDDLRHALAVEPANVLARLLLANLLLQVGRFPEARELVEAAPPAAANDPGLRELRQQLRQVAPPR